MSPVHERAVSATVEWYTPPELFTALGLEFDLDPASPGPEVVPWIPANEHYRRGDDGLTLRWYGRVWLNPPYGPAAVRFVDKMLDHWRHDDGLLLLPARTETRLFQRAAAAAGTVVFLRDRLHFIRDDGFRARSSFGSVLLANGLDIEEALDAADLGWAAINETPLELRESA